MSIYNIDDGYTLNEAHVYVGTSPPPKVAPGQFEHHEVPLSIPLTTFDAGEEGMLYIAAHAEVCTTDCEGAWAGGDTDADYTFIEEGISKKWGWYFSYIISCDERARLKRTMADMRAIGTALGSYQIDYNIFPLAATPTAFTGVLPADYYDGSTKDAWSTDFQYFSDARGEGYTLKSYGKDVVEGGEEGFDQDILFINGNLVLPDTP